jgi:hypothetical protein
VIKFLTVKNSEIIDYLTKQGATKKQAEQLAALSGGCPGVAINFFEDENLFLDYQAKALEFINLAYQRIDERFGIVRGLVSQHYDFSELINYLVEILNIWRSLARDIMLINNSCGHLIRNGFLKLKLEKLANHYSEEQLIQMIENIDKTNQYLGGNVNPRLAMENLVISI